MKPTDTLKSYRTNREQLTEVVTAEYLRKSPIPNEQLLDNMGLYLNSRQLSRILFFQHLYSLIVDKPGVIMEFGTHYGNNLGLFTSFRDMFEPYNRHRKIIGFDSFEGFPNVTKEDGQSVMMKKGMVATQKNWEQELTRRLSSMESQYALSHLKKFELIKGDASRTVPTYLEKNPHTIIVLAYFDFDIYQPTLDVLRMIKPRLFKGSVIGFDELNDPDSPGETLAVMKELGLNNCELKRLPHCSRTSYMIYQGG